MGMDVMGQNPSTKEGEYFRANVWWWRPLADYCIQVAPDVTLNCEYWHSNDGDGLDGEESRELAEILRTHIDSGETKAWGEARQAVLDALPDDLCMHCKGTGVRNDKYVQGTCNACNGKGSVRPFDTMYPFNVETVSQFATFLEGCGGFEIC